MPQTLIDDLTCRPTGDTAPIRLGERQALPEMLDAVLTQLRRAGVDVVIAVPLNPTHAAFAVVKVFVPGLENPPGRRRRRFGARAIAQMMRFR